MATNAPHHLKSAARQIHEATKLYLRLVSVLLLVINLLLIYIICSKIFISKGVAWEDDS